MRPTIVMTADLWHDLKKHLIRVTPEEPHPNEELAFILASTSQSPYGLRLLVCEMLPAAPSDFLHRSPGGLKPKPEFVLKALNRCKKEGWHLIEVHSHPFDTGKKTTFSGIDWRNDLEKMPSVATLFRDNFIHATMVVGQNSVDAHFYDRATGKISPIEQLVIVGVDGENSENLRYLTTTSASELVKQPIVHNEQYQRQTMFLGQDTQRMLHDATVAIVGLGGLGSFVALELAHLGIGHLILIDPDRVEKSNLNRLLGTKQKDVRRTKVEVYTKLIKDISSITKVTPLPLSILNEKAINHAKGADILVGCVDNHGARRILNQIAVRYIVPFVDGGSGIRLADEDNPLSIGGQVQVVLPGIGCLECRGFIDAQRAAFDLASDEEQMYERDHGYGLEEVAPSVISLNGVIASYQLWEILLLLAGHLSTIRRFPPISLYNALSREVVPVIPHRYDGCPTCGKEGVVAFGDLAPIRRTSRKTSSVPPLTNTKENDNARPNS